MYVWTYTLIRDNKEKLVVFLPLNEAILRSMVGVASYWIAIVCQITGNTSFINSSTVRSTGPADWLSFSTRQSKEQLDLQKTDNHGTNGRRTIFFKLTYLSNKQQTWEFSDNFQKKIKLFRSLASRQWL